MLERWIRCTVGIALGLAVAARAAAGEIAPVSTSTGTPDLSLELGPPPLDESFRAPALHIDAAFLVEDTRLPATVPLARPYVRELRPWREAWVHQWLVAVDQRLDGSRASPAFRDELSEAQVHWTLVVHGVEPELPGSVEKGWMDVLAVASGMATEDLVSGTLRRSETLGASWSTVRTLVSPTVSTRGGRLGLEGARPEDRKPQLAQAALDERAVGRPPPPVFRSGAALRVRELDDDDDVPLVDVAVYAAGERMLVDGWRLSGLVGSRTWIVAARQALLPTWDVTFACRSSSESPLPSRITVGALTELPDAPEWQVRTYWSRALPTQDEPRPNDTVGLELRARWRWRAPQSPDEPLLGERWNRPGPVGATDPLEREWVAAPAPAPPRYATRQEEP